MNLADYLSELLGQHDEVSVPGLGYFLRERKNGYYNDKEARFYPPAHQVRFVAQLKEDDTFAQYVADKKNISLASSKYFAEKFISKLREEAAKGKYTFADLGSFQTDNDQQLVFKPFDKIASDTAFYGYPPLDITRLAKPQGGDIKSAYAEPVVTPVSIPAPIELVEQQQYFEEETDKKKSVNVWLIVLIAITILALAIFGVYKFYPAAIDKINATYHKITGKKQDTTIPVYRHEIKADTIKKIIPVKDTTAAKTVASNTTAAKTIDAVDTATARYEVVAAKFRLKKWADNEVTRFKAKGIDAKILPKEDVTGTLLKISVGNFPTYKAAEEAMLNMEKAGKIKKDSEVLIIKSK